ncbi:CIR protein PIR protein [Plasmodium vinckei]|uniref:CIR protein PIR protein n=1 Tax=Plasmodium vinckei TaxID=5860 RepID=A0A6V7T8L9_PLAVN|nr:CIR protein PIR protein [Plasmodium vinckei]
MSRHVCEMLNSLYSQLPDDDNEGNQRSGGKLLYETYCPKIEDKYQRCNSDNDRIKAGFIYLVGQLFDNVNSDGEHEDQKSRYVYYGFMWMSYKLQQSNQNSGSSITLYEFINDHVLKDQWYEVVEEYVDPKVPLITKEADIDIMSDVYYILKEMCKFFSNNYENFYYHEDFSKYYESVTKFGEKILKKKINNANIDNVDQIYADLYDMLKNVYNEYRDYYYGKNSQDNAPPKLPEIEEIKKNFTPDLKTQDLQDSTKGDLKPQDDDGNSDQQQSEQQSSSEPESKGSESKEPTPPEPTPPEPTPLETSPPHSEEPKDGKREPSLPPAQESSQPQPQIQDSQQSQDPPLETDPKKPVISPKDASNEQVAQESIEKIMDSMKFVFNFFKPDFSSVYNTLTNFGNDVYENVLNGLKGGYSILTDFVSNVKDSIDQLNNEKDTPQSDDNGPKQKDPGDNPPSSDSPSKDLPPSPSSEQPPKIDHRDPENQKGGDKKEPSGDEKTEDKNQKEKTQHPAPIVQEPSDGSTNITSYQIPNPDDSGSNRNEIISKGVFSIIVIAIPAILAIMYMYLYYECGKKSKRKKNMKKVINSIGGKRQVQIIISSSNQKKQTKKSINSFNEKKSLLNIYKLMQADPIPFINLFFLLIFFVYKRKRDTIEW